MSSINWDLIPSHIVAIGAHNDFSGASFYAINNHGLKDVDIADYEVGVLIGVRPSSSVEIVSTLINRISTLEGRLERLRESGNKEIKADE